MTFAYIFIGIVIAERLIELKIAAKNESWMKQHGGFEVGKGHYKLFIIMHVAFFLSLMVELQYITVGFHISLFILFMLVQLCRVWCMLSLGRFWNTKIIVLPSVAVIKTGRYKYMKHPNYVIVFAELFLLPAMFGALWTASLFRLLHMSLLSVRIPLADKALGRNYKAACLKQSPELLLLVFNNISSMRSTFTFNDFKSDILALFQCLKSFFLDSRVMYEYIVSFF